MLIAVYLNWSNGGNFGKITYEQSMKPVFLTIFGQPLSSFSLFFLAAFLLAVYVIWRITKVYELDEEKMLDILILTFFGGLIVARIYFILFHLDQSMSILKILLINRYPGLSFWGGFFGGLLILKLLTLRFKLNFWQVLDFATPALFLGLSVASIGCILGSCQYGLPSNLPFAITQVGLVDKRFPIQIIESLLFFLGFLYLWKSALKFHPQGAVAAWGLFLLGLFKLGLEFFYGSRQWFGPFSTGEFFASCLIIFAIFVHFLSNKRTPLADLKLLKNTLTQKSKRDLAISKLLKNWYNFWVDLKLVFQRWRKRLFKSTNIKPNPPQF